MAEMQDKHYHIGQAIWPKKYIENDQEIIVNVEQNINLLVNQNKVRPWPNITNVVKLGITTIPGVKFILNYTNNANNDTFPTIEIGHTGFFELDVKDLAMTINSIAVADDVSITTINNNYCYIDFIYYD